MVKVVIHITPEKEDLLTRAAPRVHVFKSSLS